MSLSAYLNESTVAEPGSRIGQRELYDSFAKWSELHQEAVISKHAMTKQLLHRPGIQSSPCRKHYLGLRLASPNELKPDVERYRNLIGTRTPGLLPAFETWVLDRSKPLELVIVEAVLERLATALEAS
jgi:hypothetical protein